MSQSAVARTNWDDASSPASARLARRFEEAWRTAGGRKPNARNFLTKQEFETPGALLALLRAEIGLRWDDGSPVDPEDLRREFPELSEEDYVALVYEDFCLREEIQGSASTNQYLTRYSDVGSRLKRIFDIHALVGSGGNGGSTASVGSFGLGPLANPNPKPAFPEASQTISGFHLVEELGRGSFARVFLARERSLADRPVALKVARTGSREPQTLAKLQHTHIVPVHSYQTDELTSLHLLCMPYFGRVTLAHLLADPASRKACTGADLLVILDRLDPTAATYGGPSTGRASIRQRPYARAIAWWGARMAEALQHAHDRGVLHRDVKPSNVLITSDGMPMLLDFNLASEITLEETTKLGGTLDYMAPEHLEALADGVDDGVEERSDLYSLGVLLYEALVGRKPFEQPKGVLSISSALHQAAEVRRELKVLIRETNPEVPAAFEAVIKKCLAPDPLDRYSTASELAVDLQAVADDMPLKVAREPVIDRIVSWGRRNRKQLVTLTPIAAALIVAFVLAVRLRDERQQARARNAEEAGARIRSAMIDQEQDRPELALSEFESAERLAHGDKSLISEWRQAKDGIARSTETIKIRKAADAIFAETDALRFGLLDGAGDRAGASEKLDALLKPFFVNQHENWTTRVELKLLDAGRWPRLRDEIDELLFLRLVGGRDRLTWVTSQQGIDICMRSERWSKNPAPWTVLKDWLAGKPMTLPSDLDRASKLKGEESATTCLQWGLLLWGKQQSQLALVWLDRSSKLEPDNSFYHFVLGVIYDATGRRDKALYESDLAFVMNKESLYARFNYARMLAQTASWWPARDDLGIVIAQSHDQNLMRSARLIRGLVSQKLGDVSLARADYDEVLAHGMKDATGLSALLNRAKLDDDSGNPTRALKAYESILAANSKDADALLGRGLLLLRRGNYYQAEHDFTSIIGLNESKSRDAEAFANRALARLAMGRLTESVQDADQACELESTPGRERVALRCRLAAGKLEPGRLTDPEEIRRLPWGAEHLWKDLRVEADRLLAPSRNADPAAALACESRAVILAVLGDPRALSQIERAIVLAPGSSQAKLIRARILRYRGMTEAASITVSNGLVLEPEHPELLALRGRLRTEQGNPTGGLADIEKSLRVSASLSTRSSRAEALMALGRYSQALSVWNNVIGEDRGFAEAYIGMAQCALRLGDVGQAKAALTSALALSAGRMDLLVRVGMLTPKTWKLSDLADRSLARQ